MGAIEYFYVGFCENKKCSGKGEMVKFPVPYKKVESYRNLPGICSVCGNYLFGDIVEAEEGKEYC